ncbi:MAG: hypothetical protein ABFC84_09840 [Veillonellales bacterium]
MAKKSKRQGVRDVREETKKLLFAMYTEVNRVVPHLGTVNGRMLGMTEQFFNSAVNSLYTRGFISGVAIKIGDDDEHPASISTENVLLTRRGARFVEKQVGMSDALPKQEKLFRLKKKAADMGWDELAVLIQKAIREFSENV